MVELDTQPALGQLQKLFCFTVRSGTAVGIERNSENDPKASSLSAHLWRLLKIKRYPKAYLDNL
jgi:hypothetical protein